MKRDKRLSPQQHTVLRERGNPYWTLQLDTDDNETASHEQRRAYLKKLENPHAYHAVMGEEPIGAVGRATGQPAQRPRGISKAEFERGCRNIFGQYIPAFERGRIREHHREFILRNQNSSPERRALLLGALRRYDLGSEGGIKAQFNRERDIITEGKLKMLEKAVDESHEA
jgi:hypothetical protein